MPQDEKKDTEGAETGTVTASPYTPAPTPAPSSPYYDSLHEASETDRTRIHEEAETERKLAQLRYDTKREHSASSLPTWLIRVLTG